MSEGATYRAVCEDCGWSSEVAAYRDKPYTDYKAAKRAVNGHLGNGCNPKNTSVERVDNNE